MRGCVPTGQRRPSASSAYWNLNGARRVCRFTTWYGMPIGPPWYRPEPKSACRPVPAPIDATIALELAATGSPSTRWFHGLLAGKTGHLFAPGTGWPPAAAAATSAPAAASAANCAARSLPFVMIGDSSDAPGRHPRVLRPRVRAWHPRPAPLGPGPARRRPRAGSGRAAGRQGAGSPGPLVPQAVQLLAEGRRQERLGGTAHPLQTALLGRAAATGILARMFEREEADQLPGEGPGQQVPDDGDGGSSRDDADDQAGGADEGQSDDAGKQTGNPPNAV